MRPSDLVHSFGPWCHSRSALIAVEVLGFWLPRQSAKCFAVVAGAKPREATPLRRSRAQSPSALTVSAEWFRLISALRSQPVWFVTGSRLRENVRRVRQRFPAFGPNAAPKTCGLAKAWRITTIVCRARCGFGHKCRDMPKVRGDEHDRAKHSACCCGGKVLSVPANGTLTPALFPETPGWRSSPRWWR